MNHLLLLLLAALPLLTAAPSAPPTVIYLVRHAEKDLTPGLSDPPLTPAGELRAQLLAQKLAAAHPAALFTTDTHRTRATLAPLAQVTGLTPQVYSAREPAELAARISQEYTGRTVVVVGHSNTLLPLLAALGVKQSVKEISENQYDMLFRVTLRVNKPAQLKVSTYGE